MKVNRREFVKSSVALLAAIALPMTGLIKGAKAKLPSVKEEELFFVLMTIRGSEDHPPVRVVNNSIDVVSRGNTYSAYPFEITMGEGTLPSVTLRMDNLSAEMSGLFMLSDSIDVGVEIVRSESVDIVEVAYPTFSLQSFTVNQFELKGKLVA